MAFPHRPLEEHEAGPAVWRMLGPDAPAQLQSIVARGLAPLPPRDLIVALYQIWVKNDPELRRIPVIVLTTSRDEEHILNCYDLHANAYVTKPVDFERFIAVIRQIDEFFVSVVKLPPRA